MEWAFTKHFIRNGYFNYKRLQLHYPKKCFSTCNSDLRQFADWLHANNCLDVCMEFTGKVGLPTDLLKVDMPEVLRERQLSKAVKHATKFLEIQGLNVSYNILSASRLATTVLLPGFLIMPFLTTDNTTFTL